MEYLYVYLLAIHCATVLDITVSIESDKAAGVLSIDMNVDKASVGLNSASFWFENVHFNSTTLGNDYYCFQVVRRWYDFKPYCDSLILPNEEKEWIHFNYDELDFWNQDYHARLSFCSSTPSARYTYCDEQTVDPRMIARSQVVTFKTLTKDDGDESNKIILKGSSLTVLVSIGSIMTLLLVLSLISNIVICIKMRRNEVKSSTYDKVSSLSDFNFGKQQALDSDNETEIESDVDLLFNADPVQNSWWSESISA